MLAVYRIFEWIFRRLIPERAQYVIARMLARMLWRIDRRRRAVVVENLVPIVGLERARVISEKIFQNFAMTSVDFFCPRKDLLISAQAFHWSYVEEAYRKSKRVMLLTAHIGHWELGLPFLVSKGFAVTGVYAPYREEPVVRWIMTHRHPDVEWIPSTRGAMDSAIAALEKGRLLGMVADLRYGEKGHRVTIGSGRTHLPLGPWAIACKAQATVIPAFILRDSPGRYRLDFHEPVYPQSGSFRRQMEFGQEVFRRHLERTLLQYPEQWGVLEPFWDCPAKTESSTQGSGGMG